MDSLDIRRVYSNQAGKGGRQIGEKEGPIMSMERWRPFGGVERWDPFRVSDIQTEVNRLFDSFFGRPTSASTAPRAGARMWAPVIDLFETKDDLVVMAELPGVQEKDVSLSITGDLLTMRGEREFGSQVKEESYHRIERAYGKFERTIQLPMPVQADKVKATYRDGVLEVRLPKAEEVKPREIKIDIL
jgi:HSP20 family protein